MSPVVQPCTPMSEATAPAVGESNNVYPNLLKDAEDRAIQRRREWTPPDENLMAGSAGGGAQTNSEGPKHKSHSAGAVHSSPSAHDAPRVGLAFSGGGIRSATFNLGFAQALARAKMIRRADYLSTVSGGGYIGSFLGAWINRTNVEHVEKGVQDLRSAPVAFLRENGRYLAPNGSGDAWVATASHLRGWLTILATLGLFFIGCILLGEAGHEWLWRTGRIPAAAWRPGEPDWLWLSPWWWVAGGMALILAFPAGLVFWLLGTKPLRLPPVFWLVVAATLLTAFMGTSLRQALALAGGLAAFGGAAICASERHTVGRSAAARRWLLLGAVALLALAYFCFGGFGWRAIWDWRFLTLPKVFAPALARLHLDLAPGSPVRFVLRSMAFVSYVFWASAFFVAWRHNDLDLARRELTELLALIMIATVVCAGFALVDTLGGSWYAARGGVLAGHAGIAALWAAAQWVGPKLLGAMDNEKRASLPLSLVAGVAAAVVGLALLSLMNFWAHQLAALFGAGFTTWYAVPGSYTPERSFESVRYLAAAGGGALLFCAVLGRSRLFLNLSSDLPLYSARLTRAYVGASNPDRANPTHGGVTKPVPGDDVGFTRYHPEQKGGPLHLINATINETVLGKSQLEQRDRHGLPLVLGPHSVTVGRDAHALIVPPPPTLVARLASKVQTRAPWLARGIPSKVIKSVQESSAPTRVPIDPIYGPEFHPLAADPDEKQPGNAGLLKRHDIEMLSLGRWVGVSGAAFSTGLGQQTSLGLSFLAGIFNVRLGYWWDSEVGPLSRKGTAPLRATGFFGVGVAAVFPAQAFLLDELLARFHGPAGRQYWYLTDGGHFENTATYELIRRRVPVIVVCDCGADPDCIYDDAGNLVRKARIDFGAEIRFFEAKELDMMLERPGLRDVIGTLEELKPAGEKDEPKLSRCHATLAEVRYDGSANPGSLLLLVKPTLTGDEPLDILNYRSGHAAFPQESTLDQFFDEAQWESYRRLGQLIGEDLFAKGNQGGQLVALQQHLAAWSLKAPIKGRF